MKKQDRSYSIMLAILLLILWISPIQHTFNFVKERQLDGDVENAEDVSFDLENWMSGYYQEDKEKFLNDNFGFRATSIRIKNQLDYTLFNRLNAREIIEFNNGALLEESYLLSYLGRNSIGPDSIQKKLESLKFISDTLTKLNKKLIIVIPPGKARYFSESIPDKLNTGKDSSNYELFAARYRNYPDLNVIDFCSMFNHLKSTTPYPFFPMYGIHWSPYGVEMAADSIYNFIEATDSIKIRRVIATGYTFQKAHAVDFDIGAGLNLLFDPGPDIIAYPDKQFKQPDNYVMPKLLVIGDSFYYNLFDRFNYTFSENIFWYYFRDTRTMNLDGGPKVTVDELRSQIIKSDVIMIMVNESQIHDVGWGFLETAEKVFGKQ